MGTFLDLAYHMVRIVSAGHIAGNHPLDSFAVVGVVVYIVEGVLLHTRHIVVQP